MRRIRHGIAQTDDGTDLWWELDAGDGSGPPLCFLNGANCSTFYWPPLLRRLAGRSPVLLWDYRGHGRSGRGVAPRSITIERFAADLQTVLDAAGVDQVVLIGHSLGVMVGLEGYRQFPDRVAGLTLAFGSHGDSLANLKDPERVANVVDRAMHALGRAVQPPGVRSLVEKFLRSRPGIYAASLLGANAALLPSGYLERLMDHVTTMDPDVCFQCYRSAMRYSARDLLPSIRVPTLVIGGTRDRMTPAAHARLMGELIPGAELLMLEDGSHLGLLEEEDQFWLAFSGFLDRHALWSDRVTGTSRTGG